MPNVMRSKKSSKRPAPLTQCPSASASGVSNGITFGTYWYRLPGIEHFFICTRCYEDKLANTQFAGLFDSFFNEPLPGTKSLCDFNSERVDRILAHTVQTGNTDLLFEFAERRAKIIPCDGVGGSRGGHGIRWVHNPELSGGFIACEACYEDFLLATTFAPRFVPYPEEHPAEEVWICDLAIPYIRRSLVDLARRNDWYGFVNAVNFRSSIPPCDTKPVLLSTRTWFRPLRPWQIPKMMVCEACYLDHLGSLPTALNFTRVHPKVSDLQSLVLCSFKIKAIQACSEQILKDNYPRWHHLVNQMVLKPSCARGDIGGEWYTLPDPRNPSRNVVNFDICGACYLGYIEATGHASAFRMIEYPSGTKRVCDFSPTTARFPRFFQKWLQTVYTGDSTTLVDYAARITNTLPCARSKDVAKARWWGMDEFFFCAECYEEVGKKSYFAQLFNYEGSILPLGRCDMYTDHMRRRYLEACQDRTLDEFLNFCRYREEIWQLMHRELQRHDKVANMMLKDRSHSQDMHRMLTAGPPILGPGGGGYYDPSGQAMIPSRPQLTKHRHASAPAKLDLDHRMTEENLRKAQRKAVKESIQKTPTLIHLQSRWSEVE